MAAASSSVRDAAVQIVRTLRESGRVAYFAGGCVRDRLLGFTPKDYDVATDAPPEAVRALFRKSRFVGEAFGVVLVRVGGHDFEVATFRTDGGYVDGRRPTSVAFTDARHDALRRDFTINGLFEDPLAPAEDSIIDFVGGRQDLRDKVIRAIGDPDARLGEDYLRMLRAVRFAARLGFTLDDATAAAIRRHAPDLGRISRERIGIEVAAMLGHPSRARAAEMIQSLGLDAQTLLEKHLDNPLPTLAALADPTAEPGATERDEADLYPAALAAWLLDRHWPNHGDTQPVFEGLLRSVPEPLRLSARLTHLDQHFSSNDPRSAVQCWRSALCLSNDDRSALAGILESLVALAGWRFWDVARRKHLLASRHSPAGRAVLRALASHNAEARDVVAAIDADAPALFAQGVAPGPFLSGQDLIDAGLRPGRDFKGILEEAYNLQLGGELPDRAAAIAWLARKRPRPS